MILSRSLQRGAVVVIVSLHVLELPDDAQVQKSSRRVSRTERRGRVIDFWVAFSEVAIIVRRLVRKAWRH